MVIEKLSLSVEETSLQEICLLSAAECESTDCTRSRSLYALVQGVHASSHTCLSLYKIENIHDPLNARLNLIGSLQTSLILGEVSHCRLMLLIPIRSSMLFAAFCDGYLHLLDFSSGKLSQIKIGGPLFLLEHWSYCPTSPTMLLFAPTHHEGPCTIHRVSSDKQDQGQPAYKVARDVAAGEDWFLELSPPSLYPAWRFKDICIHTEWSDSYGRWISYLIFITSTNQGETGESSFELVVSFKGKPLTSTLICTNCHNSDFQLQTLESINGSAILLHNKLTRFLQVFSLDSLCLLFDWANVDYAMIGDFSAGRLFYDQILTLEIPLVHRVTATTLPSTNVKYCRDPHTPSSQVISASSVPSNNFELMPEPLLVECQETKQFHKSKGLMKAITALNKSAMANKNVLSKLCRDYECQKCFIRYTIQRLVNPSKGTFDPDSSLVELTNLCNPDRPLNSLLPLSFLDYYFYRDTVVIEARFEPGKQSLPGNTSIYLIAKLADFSSPALNLSIGEFKVLQKESPTFVYAKFSRPSCGIDCHSIPIHIWAVQKLSGQQILRKVGCIHIESDAICDPKKYITPSTLFSVEHSQLDGNEPETCRNLALLCAVYPHSKCTVPTHCLPLLPGAMNREMGFQILDVSKSTRILHSPAHPVLMDCFLLYSQTGSSSSSPLTELHLYASLHCHLTLLYDFISSRIKEPLNLNRQPSNQVGLFRANQLLPKSSSVSTLQDVSSSSASMQALCPSVGETTGDTAEKSCSQHVPFVEILNWDTIRANLPNNCEFL